MMDTVLNLGLNEETVKGLAEQTGDLRFALDAYRRFASLFGEIVMGVAHAKFERVLDRFKAQTSGGRDTDLKADDLREIAKRVGDPLSASMRIGVIPTISPYLLPPISPMLRRDFPKMKIHWVEEKTAVLIAALHQGALDAVLLALEADIGKVEQAVIAADPFVLATPRNHPLGMGKSGASAQELHDVGVLLLDDGHCFREQALEFCAKSKARELEFRATSLSTLAQMVAVGAGVTLLPELSVATEGKRADLKIRKFVKPPPHRTIGLVWRKGSSLTAALQKVADSIRRFYPR